MKKKRRCIGASALGNNYVGRLWPFLPRLVCRESCCTFPRHVAALSTSFSPIPPFCSSSCPRVFLLPTITTLGFTLFLSTRHRELHCPSHLHPYTSNPPTFTLRHLFPLTLNPTGLKSTYCGLNTLPFLSTPYSSLGFRYLAALDPFQGLDTHARPKIMVGISTLPTELIREMCHDIRAGKQTASHHRQQAM
ncbi:uncharacterized protein LY79DRAFT_410156 [Colletotrichum navitas]|uniref:Uncharacterized protein n=1 Tax=Colletotrichum navitas TaxID=681940 RepID=A0AAD8V0Q7_9PEZI|nr:uncharacterized protein LY79DRAFT_410156 [Colletotrichum navitas]KAK1573540.1 hypothetical protein LY79DRAFT_410156 [Colletotrichum navitas]